MDVQFSLLELIPALALDSVKVELKQRFPVRLGERALDFVAWVDGADA